MSAYSSPRPVPRIHAGDPAEALHRRLALLEEASTKAWSERTDLECRIASIEREHSSSARTNAQAFEADAMRITELAVTVAELPAGRALHNALQQLRWLDDAEGQKPKLQQLLSRMDCRLLAVERAVEKNNSSSASHEHFLTERFNELEAQLDFKAERTDQDRLTEALSQSCRDLTATLRACRQDLATLEENFRDMARHVTHYSQDVSRLDHSSLELQQAFAKRELDSEDKERQWSRRLWGYNNSNNREASPSSARRARPVSGCNANRAEGAGIPPWKPWATARKEGKIESGSTGPGIPWPPRPGGARLHSTHDDREGLWAEDRLPSPSRLIQK